MFFNVSHLTASVFIKCHLVGGPSAAQTGAKRLDVADRITSHSISFDENPQQHKQQIIPAVLACFPKGQILLHNKAKSFMENQLLFPVQFLILPAVGLKPL